MEGFSLRHEEIFLSENLAGWRAKEIMNIIYEKTGVRYHQMM
jgi:hypothetical protein